MPDTKGQSGIEHFERYAHERRWLSADGKFSSYSTTPGTGGDGPIVQQQRGEPEVEKPAKKPKKSK